MATATEILAAIDTAIYNIVSGEAESVEVMGKQFTLLDLDKLRTLRRDYAKATGYSSGNRKRILLADVSRGAGG